VAQTEQVLALVRRLADQGLGVVIISHNLQDVFKVADSIYVLYLGTMIVRLDAAATTTAEVVEYITGSRGVTGGDE
jgi:D-xylose transport system ATP-binding protein